jgi:hypothetical protein
MRRALLAILAGLLTYVAIPVYAGVTFTNVERSDAAVYVVGAMLAAYGVARAASSVRR